MRKWCLSLALFILAFSLSGCVTSTVPKTLDEKCAVANEVGKFVTLVYYAEKDKVDPQGTVAGVYGIFSEVLAAADANTLPLLFRAELEAQVRKRVKDDTHQQLALGLIELYWSRLEQKIDIEKLRGSDLLIVLKAFRTGVEEMRSVIKGPTSGLLDRRNSDYDWRLHHHVVCGEWRFSYA